MRQSNLQSEYEAHEVPDLTGARVVNKKLDAEGAKVPEHERVEISQQNLILDVVKDFYFAKYFFLKTNIMDYEGDDRLQGTFGYLSEQLLKQAVISVATAIDLTTGKPVDGKKPPGRTASLLQVGGARIHGSQIRHMGAGEGQPEHPGRRGGSCSDRDAYEDFSDLVDMSDALTDKTTNPKQVPTIHADGHKTLKMTVKWSRIRAFAPLQRESAQKEVDHFFDMLSTSVD